MIKHLLLIFGIVLIASYLAYSFAYWDMAWAVHVDVVVRVTFVLLFAALCLVTAPIYLECKDKS